MIDGERTLLHVKPSNWLYAVGRVKPGTEIGPLQAKISNNLRLWLATIDEYTRNAEARLRSSMSSSLLVVRAYRTFNRKRARDCTC